MQRSQKKCDPEPGGKKKKSLSNQKMDRRPKQTFLQRRYTDGQQKDEKMLNMSNYKRNVNQNYNETQPHSSQNGHHTKSLQITNAGEYVEKREPSYPVGGNVSWCSHDRK